MIISQTQLIITLILSTVSYILEKKYDEKKILKSRNFYIELVSILHHLLVMFSTISFFLNPILGLSLETIFRIHWVFNDNKCILSQIYNGYYFNNPDIGFKNLITFIINKNYILPAVVVITSGFLKTKHKNLYIYILLIYILVLLILKLKYHDNNNHENSNLRNTLTRYV